MLKTAGYDKGKGKASSLDTAPLTILNSGDVVESQRKLCTMVEAVRQTSKMDAVDFFALPGVQYT